MKVIGAEEMIVEISDAEAIRLFKIPTGFRLYDAKVIERSEDAGRHKQTVIGLRFRRHLHVRQISTDALVEPEPATTS